MEAGSIQQDHVRPFWAALGPFGSFFDQSRISLRSMRATDWNWRPGALQWNFARGIFRHTAAASQEHIPRQSVPDARGVSRASRGASGERDKAAGRRLAFFFLQALCMLAAGAARREVLEAIEVGIEMGGGSATAHARFALEVMDAVFAEQT